MKHLRLRKGNSTYAPLLIKIVGMTTGSILELGAGIFSTPLLHWLCIENKRKLVTYENSLDYFKFAKKFQSPNHRVRFLSDWSEADYSGHWSIALVDHSPKKHTRGFDAIKLKDSVDYIILHDSEPEEKKYGYDEVWSHFKHRYDWTVCKPFTTVISNFYPCNFQ